jgi:cation:H+ antiporter
MSPLAAALLQFLLCGVIILVTGVRLSRLGHVIAVRTGLGGTWVGLFLLASVTSLPELVTGASAVAAYDLPDIAVGDVVGSCLFNLLILALLDVRHPEPISARMHQGHVLSAGFGLVQLGLLGLALVAGAAVPAVSWIGLPSVAFIAVYVLAARSITVYERSRLSEAVEELADHESPAPRLRSAIVQYVSLSIVLVAAASVLPGLAGRIAELAAVAQSLVGASLVAAATSLPEVVVSVAAARIGALDMAAANLLGSNLFNVAIVGLDDVLYTRGPLLEHVSRAHEIALFGAMLMTGIAIVGLTIRARRKRFRLSWDALAMVVVYGLTLWVVALHR